MRLKGILSFVFILIVFFLLFFYWFVPFEKIEFTTTGNSNFSVIQFSNMQFYPNMRFPDSRISYRISDCSLKKKNDMEYAFDIVENLTILDFYPAESNEEILITCEEKRRMENGLFIAGEGGPTNITVGYFAVILNGEILLIKQSDCPKPNVALHELFHVLGFDHSTNKENIMYNITKCDQVIGDDMIELINELYSYPSHPDLAFKNVSATMNGKFLDINMTITNLGLNDSEESKVLIYADDNFVKEIALEQIAIGYGRSIFIEHIWVPKINIHEINLDIVYNFNEINKENNKIKLEIKN